MDKYLLLGYGISNKSVQKYFDEENINYDIYDDYKSNVSIMEIKSRIKNNEYLYIVKSGSIVNEHPIIKLGVKNNVKIVSDLELFYLFSPQRKIIAITGTNGKSTTCTLLKEITGYELGGNIGKPLFDYIRSNKPIIIEVSSYMSEYIDKFKANIYGIINLYPHHLDHHHDYKSYVEAKMRIFKNVSMDDFLVYNGDNLDICNNILDLKTNKVPFSVCNVDEEGNIKVFGKKIININNLNRDLTNYLENVLLVCKIAMILDVKVEIIKNVLIKYQNLKYRMNYIFEYKNIKFYNDSKATNLYAMKKACDCFKNKRVLLICGGKDSYINYDVLNMIDVSKILVTGENKDTLVNFFKLKGIKVYKFERLKVLLDNLENFFSNIDIVLFSPGFQSFDEFTSFENRGLFFESYLNKLYFSK